MSARTLVYINGVALPNPTTYNVPMTDIDSSDTMRNERGELIRNRVRQGVSKIELAWTLRSPELASLLEAITPARMSVKFFDPNTYAYKTATMYVGDRTCTMRVYTPYMDFDDIVWDCSFNLIEY